MKKPFLRTAAAMAAALSLAFLLAALGLVLTQGGPLGPVLVLLVLTVAVLIGMGPPSAGAELEKG